ncbi:MAG: cation/H(+) antiporter [Isosphaera sp.]|nr:cation/H(+) antiporter [Isosphaera sp.]
MSSNGVAPAGSGWAGPVAYLALLAAGVGLFFLIRTAGEGLTAPPAPDGAAPVGRAVPGKVDVVLHVTATLAAVIALGFALGRAFRYVGQPPVIGEVVAGLLLGPSVLGAVYPPAMHVLIPPASADPGGRVPAALQAVAQLGVILYMFLVGLELNAAQLGERAGATVAVSHASIVVPFVLGAGLALGLYPGYSHAGVPFTSFALFLGAAMAVTAFPVLARILADRGLDKTPLGVVALGCAAADDVTAWCLLAFVVGVARAEVGQAAAVVAGAAAFVAFMFLLARPALARAARRLDAGPLPPAAVPAAFLLVLLSALATEAIGVHAVFGAFLLGAVVPHDTRVARDFAARLRDPVTVLLLPAFFAYTGLRTEIGLLTSPADWLWCGAVILVATVGKVGGTVAAARLTGSGWREAAALGALMNTRGLMGLIVLNVGLDLGVISPTLFAMMVLMALATTVATAPLLRWLAPEPAGRPAG